MYSEQWNFQKEKEITYNVGIMSFLNLSNSDLDSISCQPASQIICFCDGKPDCNYHAHAIQVNRGKSFSIELIAYDQAHHPSIQCNHNLSAGGLGGQTIQNMYMYSAEIYNLLIHYKFLCIRL